LRNAGTAVNGAANDTGPRVGMTICQERRRKGEPGRKSIGPLLGAFVVATLNNGLVMMGAQATVSDIYLGTAIILAMILNVQVDRVRARRRV